MLNYQKLVFQKQKQINIKIFFFQLFRELPDIQEKTKERPFQFPYCVKARTLIHAHLHRLDTLSDDLQKGLYMF